MLLYCLLWPFASVCSICDIPPSNGKKSISLMYWGGVSDSDFKQQTYGTSKSFVSSYNITWEKITEGELAKWLVTESRVPKTLTSERDTTTVPTKSFNHRMISHWHAQNELIPNSGLQTMQAQKSIPINHKPQLGLRPCLLKCPNDRIWKSKWRVQGLCRPSGWKNLQVEEHHGTITKMLAWEICIANGSG